MAIPTVVVGGHILGPNGAAPVSGTISAELSQPARALDGAMANWLMGVVSKPLGAGGAVALSLAPNDALLPSGTFYKFSGTLTWSDGSTSEWSSDRRLASSPNPVDLAAIPRV
jgi:hypothetical protein